MFLSYLIATLDLNLVQAGVTPKVELKQHEMFSIIGENIKLMFTPDTTMGDIFGLILNIFIHLWNYPIFKLDHQPIAFSNIIIGIFLLWIGFKYCTRLSRKTAAKLTQLAHIDDTAAEATGKILNYIFLTIVTIIVLEISHVPITVFTVFGGALAIGIGLGTQHISNDFISGLIILFERSFKIGDVIEVEDQVGTVQHIGSRCTFLRNLHNMYIIVPNSHLLRHKIINWSYNNNLIRVHSKIGVRCEAPVDKVINIIETIMRSHPYVEQVCYVPKAFLIACADNMLTFEMCFAINLDCPQEKREILSELNTKIVTEFKRNQIPLATLEQDVSHKEPEVDDIAPLSPDSK